MAQTPPEGWFRERAEASGEVFFITQTLPVLCLEFISENAVELFGCTAQELIADPALFGTLDDESLMSLRPGEGRRVEVTWQHQDGQKRWNLVDAVCLEREDGSVVLEGVARDITDLRHAQKALADSEERYRLLAENAWDVIWTMALDGTITYVSPSVERVRGITPAEAAAQTIDEIHPPHSQARVLEYYQRLFTAVAVGGELPVFRGEQEYYRKDGSIMTGELQVIPQVDSQGNVVQILGVTRDISERKQWEADLALLAITDSLTGAYNRRHGEELMHGLISSGSEVTLLMLDIDHFKRINDTQGHRAGDLALTEFSHGVRSLLRPGDVFARWGGEEFVVLLPVAQDVGVRRAEEMCTVTRENSDITVSVGVASGAGVDLDVLLHDADEALYRAKADGRDCVRVAATGRRRPLSPA